MKKRVLALLLAAVLLINSVPMAVFAEDAPASVDVSPAEAPIIPNTEPEEGSGGVVMSADETAAELEAEPFIMLAAEEPEAQPEPCDTCGVVGCEKDHIKCIACSNYDCTVQHVYCNICEKYDCGVDHTRLPLTSTGSNEDYSGDVGKFAVMNETVQSMTVSEGAGGAVSDFWHDDFLSGTVFVIDGVYVDGNGVWYQVSFCKGGTNPDSTFAAGWPIDPWVKQADDEGDALRFVKLCDVCGEPDCKKTHVWCNTCKKYDCGVNHNLTPPATGCGCCDHCLEGETSKCCEDCTCFVEPEEPDEPQREISGTVTDSDGNAIPGMTITVEGNGFDLPAGAQVVASIPSIDGEELEGVFDIKVMVDGEEWQPVDYGKTVTITIPVDTDADYVDVIHFIDHARDIDGDEKIIPIAELRNEAGLLNSAIEAYGDGTFLAYEQIDDLKVKNRRVSFSTNSFSIYTLTDGSYVKISEGVEEPVVFDNSELGSGGRNFQYYASPGQKFVLQTKTGSWEDNPFSTTSEDLTVTNQRGEYVGLFTGYIRLGTVEILETAQIGSEIKVNFKGTILSGAITIHVVREVTIDFDSNGKTVTEGTMPADVITAADGTVRYAIPTKAVPKKAGNYKFLGWDTSYAGNGKRYVYNSTNNTFQPADFVLTEDVTLYAIWEGAECKVNFDPNGGEGTYPERTINYNDPVKMPEGPNRGNDYIFLGWCVDPDDPNSRLYQKDDTMTVLTDVTMVAVWGVKLTIMAYGCTPAIQMKNEYAYTNLSERSDFVAEGTNGYSTVVREGAHKDTRFRFAATGTDVSFKCLTTGSAVYSWVGNNNKNNYYAQITVDPAQTSAGLTANTTITVSTNANEHIVSFETNNGTPQPPSITVTKSTKTPLPTGLTRAGYDFKGWYYDSAFTLAVEDPLTNVTESIVLYAKWDPVTYTITYDLNGGNVNGTNPADYTSETATFTLINPTKENYSFEGWTGSNGDTPQTFVQVPKGSSGKRTYIANWTENTVTIQYVAKTINGGSDGGSVSPTKQQIGVVSGKVEGSAPSSMAAEKAHYDFVGWFDNPNGTGKALSEQKQYSPTLERNSDGLYEDAVYYALFAPTEYTAKFKLTENDTNPLTKTFTVVDALELDSVSREEYIFDGWKVTLASGNWSETQYAANESSAEKGKYGDVTLTAQWKVMVRVSIQNEKGEAGNGSIAYNLGSYGDGSVDTSFVSPFPIPLGAVPGAMITIVSATGYEITDVVYEGVEATETPYTYVVDPERGVQAPIKIVAKTKPTEYNITYDLAGGSFAEGLNNPQKYTIESETITLQKPKDREGYTFNGWEVTENTDTSTTWSVGERYTGTSITGGKYGNVTLTARWVCAIQYVVKTNGIGELVGGKVSTASETIETHAAAQGATATPEPGYQFVGWYDGERQVTNAETTTITPEKENGLYVAKTYTAVFELIRFDLVVSVEASDVDGQIFIFDVECDSTVAKDVPVSPLQVVLTENKTSITIKGLPIGIYTVTEKDNWSWRLATVENKTVKWDDVVKEVEFEFKGVDNDLWLNGYSNQNGSTRKRKWLW